MLYLIVKPRSKTNIENQEIKPMKWRNKLVLIFRWLLGGVVGYKVSLFLLMISETRYPPVLGPIISGQRQLFYNLLHSDFKPNDEILEISILIYLIIWGLIGALLASGNKIQKRIGAILLVVYILSGIGFTIFSIFMFMST